MGDELAGSNVNRSYSLAATSIAIFTFSLFFMYPKYLGGEISAWLFQVSLVVMGLATFSFVFASFFYYCASVGSRMKDADRVLHARRGDRSWLLGFTLLLLAPTLILFAVGLRVVGAAWLVLWLVYLRFVLRHFPQAQAAWAGSGAGSTAPSYCSSTASGMTAPGTRTPWWRHSHWWRITRAVPGDREPRQSRQDSGNPLSRGRPA